MTEERANEASQNLDVWEFAGGRYLFAALDPTCMGIDPPHLVILAGAGVSVERMSFLPTARDFLAALYEASLPETFDWSRLMISNCGPRFELVLNILQTFDRELEILDVLVRAGKQSSDLEYFTGVSVIPMYAEEAINEGELDRLLAEVLEQRRYRGT